MTSANTTQKILEESVAQGTWNKVGKQVDS